MPRAGYRPVNVLPATATEPVSGRCQREQRDDLLKAEIPRVYDENHSVYGVRKVWRQLLRENISVARCTVSRLMKVMGLAGVRRGKKVRTTVSRKAEAAHDRVKRQFVAERPDQLWVADFTYVSTWQGFAYVAFIIDVFAGRIVGWGYRRRWKPRSCWTRWSRRCGPDAPRAPSITQIKGHSTCRWRTRSGFRTRSYWHQRAVPGTPTTMRWQRASTGFTKRR